MLKLASKQAKKSSNVPIKQDSKEVRRGAINTVNRDVSNKAKTRENDKGVNKRSSRPAGGHQTVNQTNSKREASKGICQESFNKARSQESKLARKQCIADSMPINRQIVRKTG